MRLSAGLLMGIAVSTVAGLALAVMAGKLTVPVILISLAIGGLLGAYTFYACRHVDWDMPKPGPFEKAVIFFFVLFCLRNFLWYYYHTGAGIFTLNRYPYADLHFHLAFIQNFAKGTQFWPSDPVFTGALLRYHFGMDLFTAFFVKLGAPLTSVFPLLGLVLGMITVSVLFLWGRGFAVAGFLFLGGIAGYLFFTTGSFEDYQAALAWKSIPLTTFLPQRGFLFGFPAGLLVLWSWRRRFLENKEGLPMPVEGILWGVMPLFQMQTFMFLSFIFLIWSVASKKVNEMLPVYLTAVLLAAPIAGPLTHSFQKASMFWIKPGWMMDGENPFFFYIINFGFWVPLIFWALYRVLKSRSAYDRLMFLPPFILLCGLMFVMLSPWGWDNTKMMIWSFLVMFPVMDQTVLQKLRFPVRAAFLFLLFFSGFVSVISSMTKENRGSQLIARRDLDGVCYALRGIPSEARIATAQKAYHPVLMCGRKVVAGYGGILNGFGYERKNEVETALRRVMTGEFDWREVSKSLGAQYLFWGPFEESSFETSNRPWEMQSFRIAEGPWGSLYDIQKPSRLSEQRITDVPGEGQGLQAAYFENQNQEGAPVRTEIAAAVDFHWDDRSRPLSAPFSMRIEGEVYIPETGEVTFYLASDDGSLLEIGNKIRIDNLGVHPLRVRKESGIFEKGWYPLALSYFDVGGGAELVLWWKQGAGKEEKIGPAYYRPKS